MNANSNYSEILSKIEAIRRELNGETLELNLPQIVVIGDQSSGKSSLLSEISGIPFPAKVGITTKCPIVVYTKYNKTNETPKYSLCHDNIETIIDRENLCEKILSIQEKNVGSSKVIDMPITILAEGNSFEDLVLVDLPGIIAHGDGKNEVIAMIKQFIKPEQSLILIVTEAKQDEENASALDLAKQFDSEEERSIRVLTKFDTFDTPDSENRAKDIVSHVTELSPHAIICRPNGDDYSKETENKLLLKYDLPENRYGVLSLRSRLPNLLNKLIKTNMPNLKKQIQTSLSNYKLELLKIGESCIDNTKMIVNIQEILYKDFHMLRKDISILLATFRDDMHETKSCITMTLVDELYFHDTFTCIFFQGNVAFDIILKKMVEIWRIILDKLHDKIIIVVEQLFNIDKLEVISIQFKKCIKNNWIEYCYNMFTKCKIEINFELEKELKFKTMNHYLTAKYKENLMMSNEMIKSIANEISNNVSALADECKLVDRTNEFIIKQKQENAKRYNEKYESDLESGSDIVGTKIYDIIKSKLKTNEEEFNREPIEIQHKRRILAASEANWSVSHKNLCDNILSTIDKIIIEGTYEWINKNLISDNNLRTMSFEDPSIPKLRIKLKNKILVLEKSNVILNIEMS
jgi:GTPase SAR1 family protein